MIRYIRQFFSNYGKANNCALIVSDGNGRGYIVAFDGDALAATTVESGFDIDNIAGLEHAPCGLSLWFGDVRIPNERSLHPECVGNFRCMTRDERSRFAETECPWEFVASATEQ